MAKSDSLGVTFSQLGGLALSNLISLGSIGDIAFEVSPYRINTFETLTRATGAVFVDHEVAGGKPVSEMTGETLDEIDLRISLNASLGVSPYQEAVKLREMLARGDPQELTIGYHSLGKFTLREMSDEWLHTSGTGRALMIVIDLHLVEYIETVPTQAQQKQRQDEIKRPETGKGGPARLPGAAEPTKKRVTSPRIDPVTRMPI